MKEEINQARVDGECDVPSTGATANIATSDVPSPVTSDTIMFDEDERMRELALKQVYENAQDHDLCHDFVCNGNRRFPRGVRGHGCSCNGREARLHADVQTLQDFRERVMVIAAGFAKDGATVRKNSRDYTGLPACCAAELRNASGRLKEALSAAMERASLRSSRVDVSASELETKPTFQEGDWVMFRQNNRLVIGAVRFTHKNGINVPYLITDIGAVAESDVLEYRGVAR